MSRSFLLFGFILYSVFLSSLANASDIDLSAPMDKGGWKLIWSEEFDYTGFPDSTKWSYDTEGNVYQWGNNVLAYIAERSDSYAFYETTVWLKSLPTFIIASVTFIGREILWHCGYYRRLHCRYRSLYAARRRLCGAPGRHQQLCDFCADFLYQHRFKDRHQRTDAGDSAVQCLLRSRCPAGKNHWLRTGGQSLPFQLGRLS